MINTVWIAYKPAKFGAKEMELERAGVVLDMHATELRIFRTIDELRAAMWEVKPMTWMHCMAEFGEVLDTRDLGGDWL